MSVFDSLGKQSNKSQLNLAQLKSNPSATLKQAGLNIPEDMNNPQQIINYLISSGQIQNARLQAAQRLLGTFGRK